MQGSVATRDTVPMLVTPLGRLGVIEELAPKMRRIVLV